MNPSALSSKKRSIEKPDNHPHHKKRRLTKGEIVKAFAKLDTNKVAEEFKKPEFRPFALSFFEAMGSTLEKEECKNSQIIQKMRQEERDAAEKEFKERLDIKIPVPKDVILEAQKRRKPNARVRNDTVSRTMLNSGFLKIGDRVVYGKDQYKGTIRELSKVFVRVEWDQESINKCKSKHPNHVIHEWPRVKNLQKIVGVASSL